MKHPLKHAALFLAATVLLTGSGAWNTAGQAAAQTVSSPQPTLTVATSSTTTDHAVQTRQNGKGTLHIDAPDAKKGDAITVTATPEEGYYLAQIRIRYQEDNETKYTALPVSAGTGTQTASFTMPAEQVTVRADFVSITWDGTIDLSWYNASQSEYTLSYPAQLQGAATLVNGLFNDIPVREIKVSDGTAKIPDLVDASGNAVGLRGTTAGYVKQDNRSGYQTFADTDGDGRQTSVVGNLHLLKIGHNSSDVGSNNKVTTTTYWFGSEDFTGKTISLGRDMNMGGTLAGGARKTVASAWSGPNYMPIGGQYSMDKGNGYTRLTAGFNGTLNGKGHMIHHLYVSRHTETFGNCQAVGLIGLAGIHRVENGTVATPVIENVAVDGMIHGNRSIGGIVGKTVHAKGVQIRNCMNFATVYNTDAKGCGGIVGAAWYDPSYGDKQVQIRNCANFGLICTGYNKNAGGLVGSSEAFVSDSYSLGYATGEGKGNTSAGNALGTNNGGAVWYNCYTLKGAGSCTRNDTGAATPYVYGATTGSAIRVLDAPTGSSSGTNMKDISPMLNGKVKNNGPDENGYMNSDSNVIQNTKRAWVEGKSSETQEFISTYLAEALSTVNSWHDPQQTLSMTTQSSIANGLSAVDATGFPVPRTFLHDAANLTKIVSTGTPTLDYLSGETFDTGDHTSQSTGPQDKNSDAEFSIWAVFDDGTCLELDEYEVLYENGNEFSAGDTSVTVKVSCLGKIFEQRFSVTVTPCQLLSMAITAEPTNTLYAKGDTFDPNGMTITAEYGTKSDNKVSMTVKAKYADNQIAYTKVRASAPQTTVPLSTEAAKAYDFRFSPSPTDPLTPETSAITVSHTFNGETLRQTIPITVLASAQPNVEKDGIHNTKTVHIASADDFLWFANQVNTGAAPDMNAVQDANIDLTGSLALPVGVKGKTSTAYSGTYDGKGHSLTVGLSRNDYPNGLFYSVSGTIRNLTVKGSVSGGSQVGAIAAQLDGGTIQDCRADAEIDGSHHRVGGIAGRINGEQSTISGCTVSSHISGASAVGGIAGEINASHVTLTGCEVTKEASVTGTAVSDSGTGGIAGYVNSNGGQITKCHNAAPVKGTAKANETGFLGGLTGALFRGTLHLCSNQGTVTAEGTSRLGGITGQAAVSAVIDAVYHTGTLTLTDTDGTSLAGGLAGSTTSGTVLRNSFTTGPIHIAGESTQHAVGAICGSMHTKSDLRYNYALTGIAEALTGRITDAEGSGVIQPSQAAFMTKEMLESEEAVTKLNTEEPEAAFTVNCTGWPILTWEPSTHQPGTAVKENIIASGLGTAGSYDLVVRCTVCGKVIRKEHVTTDPLPIPLSSCRISGVRDQTYTGKNITQTISVVYGNKKGTFTIAYPGGRKEIGPHQVKLTGTGLFTGTVTQSYRILPAAIRSFSVKAGKRKATLRWKKGNGGVQYQLAYRKKGRKKWSVKSVSGNQAILKKLNAKKKYQFRIRAYRKVRGKLYTGSWSAVKTVKIK